MFFFQINFCYICWIREIFVIVRVVDAMFVYVFLVEGVEIRKVVWFGEFFIIEFVVEELFGNDQF